MIVTEINKEDMTEWDQYVLRHPAASGYHLSGWRRVIEEAFGHQTRYLMAKPPQGNAEGILPLVLLSSRLFGRFWVSMPFLNYGGVLSNSAEAQQALLDAAVDAGKKTGASHIELRHVDPVEIEWPSKRHKVSMHLDLPSEFEALWKGFSSKLRSQIRRAQKEGMSVQIGGEETLDHFYEVFSRNMRDLGTPVYGRNFFRAILKQFPKEARITVVSLGERPLAAGFLFEFRETIEIIWASSDRRYNRLAPNMLLYSTVLEYACKEGFRRFDFGRSTPGSGTYRFKEQWGAKPVPLHWYYWLKEGGPLPELSPANGKFQLAIALWRRMPLSLSQWLGPRIVKFIP
jgi:FemAB-related protein (PEP-CTERM system-associated)